MGTVLLSSHVGLKEASTTEASRTSAAPHQEELGRGAQGWQGSVSPCGGRPTSTLTLGQSDMAIFFFLGKLEENWEG